MPAAPRLSVPKTLKLFIGGKFPRTESGRVLTATSPRGAHLAHYCRASRKDLRDAVSAARKGADTCAGRFSIASPKCWSPAPPVWRTNSPPPPA
jgi:hypothetical protein